MPQRRSAKEIRNTTPRDTIQTQITRGGPPNRATDENDNVSNRRQFNINFTQINLNKQKAATGDLALFITNKEKPFVLEQEPHVNGKNLITRLTRDTKIIASRNTDSSPRACIYYHKAMTKQLWIKTLVDGKNTILASCYMDRNDALCPPKLAFKDIVELDYAKAHNLALVVGSDVNAHNTVWNSRICDKVGDDRGDRLLLVVCHILEYILENNLFIENLRNTPTFDNGRWNNVIDLINQL